MAKAFTTGMKGPEAVDKLNALYLRVGVEYKGDWSPVYDYAEGDLVFSEGTTWRRAAPGVAPVKPSVDTGWTIFARGGPGPANVLSIGTVTSGATPSATITGDAPAQTLNLVLAKGDGGAAATVAVGAVATGAPGSAVTVTNSGTPSAAVLDFKIPKGADGLGNVASVTASAPLASSGGANPNISISAATTAAAGTMSAADKTKLDSVEANAQANPTLKTVNGAALAGAGNIATAVLGANTFTGDQTLSGKKVINPLLEKTLELRATAAIASGVLALDLSNAITSAPLNANITSLALTNNLASDTACQSHTLELTAAGTARTVLWPAGNGTSTLLFKWAGGTAPTMTSANGKRDTFAFKSVTQFLWDAYVVGQNQ